MREKYHLLIFSFVLILIFSSSAFPEGTKQVRPASTDMAELQITSSSITSFASYGAAANYRLYIHIANAGETILFGLNSDGTRTYVLKDPTGATVLTGPCPTSHTAPTPNDVGYIVDWNQAVIGPFASSGGYSPLSYKVTDPTKLGDYYIQFGGGGFGDIVFPEWDFQVVTGANVPAVPADTINGRVFSQAWQFYADLVPTYKPFSGKLFVYSDDGIVTSCKYDDSHVGLFSMFCNSTGCTNTGTFNVDRQSKNSNTSNTYPGIAQYKIFLNNPDPAVYPDGVYGAMIGAPDYPYLTFDPGYPECSGHKIIVVEVNKPGDIEVKITLPYGSPGTDVSLYKNVTVPGTSINTLYWDGKDGLGVPVPDGTQLTITITYLNGLTNLPLWDIEQNGNGFVVTLVRPINPAIQNPDVYWDDSQLTVSGGSSGCPYPPQSVNLTGCVPGSVPSIPGCHAWNTNHQDCHNKMINTWWYSASSSNATLTMPQTATPPLPVSTSPVERCGPGTIDFTATVLPVEVVRWYDQQTPGGTLLATGSPVTLNFPVSGVQHVYAEAYNPTSLCVSSSRKDITVNVIPVPDAPSGNQNEFRCGPGDITLTALPGTSMTNTVDWYPSASGGAPLLLGSTTYTFYGLSTTTTIYAETRDPNNPVTCMSVARTPFTAEIRPVPTVAPLSQTICSENITALSLTSNPPGSTFEWNNVTSTPPGAVVCCYSAPGSGSEITDQLVNTTPNPATVTYNIIPTLNQCTGIENPVTVLVNPLPVPVLGGNSTVCQGITGNLYSTDAGKNNYSWSINGGTITAGGTPLTNTATVTWTSVGTESISVNYTDPLTLCTGGTATVQQVTVKALPVPTITGASIACVNTPGYQYGTEAGMTGYSWAVNGGTFTPGPTPDIINVIWTSVGSHTITVDYTALDGCNASAPTVDTVMVTLLPVVTIAGTDSICTGIPTVYSTQAGMSNYTWNISAGGTINSGAGTNSINVTWNTPGIRSVSVNYSLGTGCTAQVPTSLPVRVKQSTPPTILPSVNPVCESFSAVYTTQPGMSAYNWTVSPGGIITSGLGTNSINVTWNTTTNQTVRVNFTNQFGCIAPSPTIDTVDINPLPITTINGNLTVCQDFPTLYTYQTSVINPLATYNWQIIAGNGTITPSAAANPININWNASGTAKLKISALSGPGCPASRIIDIAINPKTDVSMISCFDPVTTRSAKRFLLKGGSPPYTLAVDPPQGEYIFSPATAALQYDAVSGNYYFNPSLVPGNATQTFTIYYQYTNQFACPAKTTNNPVVQTTVQGVNPPCSTTMTDPRDGKTYGTTLVAGRCWMTENLNYKKGLAPISIGTPMTDNCLVEKYCPPSDPTCTSKAGSFYQWDELIQYAITDAPNYQGLCPPGWHVPTETEWQSLIDNIDPSFVPPNTNGLAGASLKDMLKPFDALLTGINYLNDTWAFTTGSTMTATMFWTSTSIGTDKAIARGLNDPYNPSVSRYPSAKANAFPVRCIKD